MIGSSGTFRIPPPVSVIFSGMCFSLSTATNRREDSENDSAGERHDEERDDEHRRDPSHHGPQRSARERARPIGSEPGVHVAFRATDAGNVLRRAQRADGHALEPPAFRSAAPTALRNNIAMVVGPTPPIRGVM